MTPKQIKSTSSTATESFSSILCFVVTLLSLTNLNADETSQDLAGTYHSVSFPPSDVEGELIYGVEFTIWLPPNVQKLRGIIVHQHGCGTGACKGGKTAAYDLHWQALAKKNKCALLGPSYAQPEGADCRMWCDPRNGSNQAFLKAIQVLAGQSKYPELATAPWCLWGHSGGGYWASIMQTIHPERIVAIWFQSGTAYSRWESGEIKKPQRPAAMYQIPMVANPGVKERDHERFQTAWNGSLAMFKDYRQHGAPIAFAPDPLTGHECGDSRYLAIPFFDACLELRLPENGENQLRQIDQSKSWLAQLHGDEALPASKFKGDRKAAVWLPNERVAVAWQEFVTTGSTQDTTPPPAPNNVNLIRKTDRVELTWQVTADFESGIQQFIILKDGQEIDRVPRKPVGRFGRPLFQKMSYHDTPEAPLPELKWTTNDKTQAAYSVKTVNSVGLSSPASPAVN